MVDLNTLVSPDAPFFLYWAPFIDDNGEIGAFGLLPDGNSHAVLLIPCDANHRNIAACDYSLVAASATEATTSVAPRTAALILNRAASLTAPSRSLTARENVASWRARMVRQQRVPIVGAPKN